MFTIPCTISGVKVDRAMLDLGVSINVMPYSLYETIKLGPLRETSVVIQLADRSNTYPRGVIEDVMVEVDKLVFPADFYVIDMSHDDYADSILLGRPFLGTTRMKINVYTGALTVGREEEVVKLSIFDCMKKPKFKKYVCRLDSLKTSDKVT